MCGEGIMVTLLVGEETDFYFYIEGDLYKVECPEKAKLSPKEQHKLRVVTNVLPLELYGDIHVRKEPFFDKKGNVTY